MMNITNENGRIWANQPGKQGDPGVEKGTGSFKNDPDDPNNPNEVIEREREHVLELENTQNRPGTISDNS
jgi:hypothetical protein